MANPNIPQGVLNRIKASIGIPDFPALNVTPPYLGKDQISVNFDGPITSFIATSTGAVQSKEPYQKVTITIHLLKTQSIVPQYKAKIEDDSNLGTVTVYPDVSTGSGLPPYTFFNCAIESGPERLSFNGMDAGWVITIGGYYLVNNSLFN